MRPNRAARPQLSEPVNDGAMSFVEHLEELRKRIILAGVGVGVAVCVTAFFGQVVLDFIFKPINALLPPGGRFVAIGVAENFSIYMQAVVISAAIVAAPWVLLQVWLFIAPGLHQREKRFAIPFVLLTTLGCVGGALFSHFVAFRALMQFFAGFRIESVATTPSVESVFGLYIRLMMGMALVFQMPTIAFFLAKLGLVTARFLISKLQHAVVILFVVAAIVTPSTDPWNQTILAGTMIGLYLICIVIVAVFGRSAPRSDAAVLLVCASASMIHRNVLPFRARSMTR